MESDPLASIAGMLVDLPLESVEALLVSVDALVDVGGPAGRPGAAALIRTKAALAVEPSRAARLLAAADAIEAGRPCALTAAGQTWREAAEEAGRTSPEEWRERAAQSEKPFEAMAPEIEEPPVIIDRPLPRLPRLEVKHFFPGLVVKLRKPLVDTRGREAPVGQRLSLLDMTAEGPEGAKVYHLVFNERSFRLDVTPQDDRSVVGNGGNAWFHPVPEPDALEELWSLVDDRLTDAEQAVEDQDDPDQIDADMLLAIRTDLDEVGEWLQRYKKGPPPTPECAPVAAEFFGKRHETAIWVDLLFAAIPHCPPE